MTYAPATWMRGDELAVTSDPSPSQRRLGAQPGEIASAAIAVGEPPLGAGPDDTFMPVRWKV